MRSRATVVLLLLALAATAVLVTNPAALGASKGTVLAQQPDEEASAEGAEGQDDEGAGQDDPDAETGASEEESEGGATAETGPPWTYQMARITLALTVLMFLGLGYLYYRLVFSRRKGQV